MGAIENDLLLTNSEKSQRKQSLYINYSLNGALSHSLNAVSPLSNSFYPNDTVESVVGKLIYDEIFSVNFNLTGNLLDSSQRKFILVLFPCRGSFADVTNKRFLFKDSKELKFLLELVCMCVIKVEFDENRHRNCGIFFGFLRS